MGDVARVELDGQVFEFPIVVGTEGERAIDISALRKKTGYITLDDGYSNTGSCKSAITFIDGETGILPAVSPSSWPSAAGSSDCLPADFRAPAQHRASQVHRVADRVPAIRRRCSSADGFQVRQPDGHPVGRQRAQHPGVQDHPENDDEALHYYAARLISKVRTLAAASYKSNIGEPITYPRHDLRYVDNFPA